MLLNRPPLYQTGQATPNEKPYKHIKLSAGLLSWWSEIFSTINRVPMHTVCHYQPPITMLKRTKLQIILSTTSNERRDLQQVNLLVSAIFWQHPRLHYHVPEQWQCQYPGQSEAERSHLRSIDRFTEVATLPVSFLPPITGANSFF